MQRPSCTLTDSWLLLQGPWGDTEAQLQPTPLPPDPENRWEEALSASSIRSSSSTGHAVAETQHAAELL